jgi:hypothetical protein
MKNFYVSRSIELSVLSIPKHCSWLNQIEMWFGMTVRKLEEGVIFLKAENLKKQINAFIGYFNKTYENPFIGQILPNH